MAGQKHEVCLTIDQSAGKRLPETRLILMATAIPVRSRGLKAVTKNRPKTVLVDSAKSTRENEGMVTLRLEAHSPSYLTPRKSEDKTGHTSRSRRDVESDLRPGSLAPRSALKQSLGETQKLYDTMTPVDIAGINAVRKSKVLKEVRFKEQGNAAKEFSTYLKEKHKKRSKGGPQRCDEKEFSARFGSFRKSQRSDHRLEHVQSFNEEGESEYFEESFPAPVSSGKAGVANTSDGLISIQSRRALVEPVRFLGSTSGSSEGEFTLAKAPFAREELVGFQNLPLTRPSLRRETTGDYFGCFSSLCQDEVVLTSSDGDWFEFNGPRVSDALMSGCFDWSEVDSDGEEHQVVSQINGANGEFTGTDDLDQLNGSHTGDEFSCTMSVFDSIGCVCPEKDHFHIAQKSYAPITAAKRAYLKRAKKRGEIQSCTDKKPIDKPQKRKPRDQNLSFSGLKCEKEVCNDAHFHYKGNSFYVNVKTDKKLYETVELTDEEEVDMTTLLGADLKFDPKVKVEAVDDLPLVTDGDLQYGLWRIGISRNNGVSNGVRNMCLLISISEILRAGGVAATPMELKDKYFGTHKPGDEYDIGEYGLDDPGLTDLLMFYSAKIQVWELVTDGRGKSRGWGRLAVLGFEGSENVWHIASGSKHFEAILGFQAKVLHMSAHYGAVVDFDIIPSWQALQLDWGTLLGDDKLYHGVDFKSIYRVEAIDKKFRFLNVLCDRVLTNKPLALANKFIADNGGDEKLLKVHSESIIASEVRLNPPPLDRLPEEVGSCVLTEKTINPSHKAEVTAICDKTTLPEVVIVVDKVVKEPVIVTASVPLNEQAALKGSDSFEFGLWRPPSEPRKLVATKKFEIPKKDLEIPKTYSHVVYNDGVVLDTAIEDDVYMNMSSVEAADVSFFQQIEDAVNSLFRSPVAYALPETSVSAQHTLNVDMYYESKPTMLWRVLTLGFARNSKIKRPNARVDVLQGVYTSTMRGLIWKDLSENLIRTASSIGNLANADFWTWCVAKYKEKVSTLNSLYFSASAFVDHDIKGRIRHYFHSITCNTICYVISREAIACGVYSLSIPAKIGINRKGKSTYATGRFSVGGNDTFMGVIKANRLMDEGVAVNSGELSRGLNYTIRSSYDERPAGVYDEGFTRILPMKCLKSLDWEYNHRYTMTKRTKFVVDGKINFPVDEDERLFEIMRYAHNYVSVYGYAFANSGVILGDHNYNLAGMVERHWKKRSPEELEIKALRNYCIAITDFDMQLLANQSYFARYLVDEFVSQTRQSYGQFDYFTDIQEAASYLIKEKHPKQKLRMDAYEDINLTGEIGKRVFKPYLVWKPKKMEIAKFNKPLRVIVDAQTANSLPNVHISNAWKGHSADKLVVYNNCVSIEFASCPSPVGLAEVFRSWDEFSYSVVIKNYSDDSIIGIWNPSIKAYDMFNTDIRANDGSHSGWTWSVFANLLSMPVDHARFLFEMVFAENYLFARNKRDRIAFKAKYGYLPSGIGATSIANNTAMLMIAWMLSRHLKSGYSSCLELVTLSAYRCGFLLTFEAFNLNKEYSRMQFLKNSPVRLPSGDVMVIPNLGRILRYSGRSKNDVTVKQYPPPLLNGVAVNVFKWYQTLLTYGDCKRVFYSPIVRSLCPYFDLVDSRHHDVITKIHSDREIDLSEQPRLFPSREQYYSRYVSYGATDVMIDEFEGLLSQQELGTVIYCAFVDLVLSCDYGLSPVTR